MHFDPRTWHTLRYLDSFRDVTNGSWVQPNQTGHFIANGFCVLKPTDTEGIGGVAARAEGEAEGALHWRDIDQCQALSKHTIHC